MIEYGARTIEVELSFSPRKRLSISVHPDLRVTVAAPEGRSEVEVLQRVRKRAAWIVKHLRRFEGRPLAQAPRRYLSGETYRYLGRQYRLKVVEGRTPTTLDGVPEARSFHTAVWTGEAMIVWGGIGTWSGYRHTGAVYSVYGAMPPVIFADGFEQGSAAAWSACVGCP